MAKFTKSLTEFVNPDVVIVAHALGYTCPIKSDYKQHPFGRGWVHKSVHVPASIYIGEGSLVRSGVQFKGNTIGISESVLINPNVVIGDHVNIASQVQIDAKVRIGEGTSIGRECNIASGVNIGSQCILGKCCRIGSRAGIGDNVIADFQVDIYYNTSIGYNVRIGAQSRIENGSTIGSEVCIGHSVILAPKSQIGGGIELPNWFRVRTTVRIPSHNDMCEFIVAGKPLIILRNLMCYTVNVLDEPMQFNARDWQRKNSTGRQDFIDAVNAEYRSQKDAWKFFECVESAIKHFSNQKIGT